MNPQEEVGEARVQENEKIADALKSSIFAGNLLFAPSSVRDELIQRYEEMLKANTQPPPATGQAAHE